MFDEDSDGDAISDRSEGSADSDGDGLVDRLDEDADNDGLDDRLETSGDSDGDGIEDRLDTDSDDDGLSDADEGSVDSDGDGTPDNLDTDADDDGVSDAEEGQIDTDQDGLPDNLDTDADDDGVPDADEGSGDVDGDGIPNNLDTDTDADDDGVSDADEGQGDSDADGIPNFLDRRRADVEVTVVTVVTAASIVAGEVTELQLEIGPDLASATTARLSIPEGLEIDLASTPDDCALSGRLLTCELGDLAVAQTVTRSIRAQVLGKTTNLEMAATVQATEGEGQTTTGPIAVLDSAAVRSLADGVRSEEGALVVVVLTAILCGGIILSLTREEQLRRH
jgi:hypothetical protein